MRVPAEASRTRSIVLMTPATIDARIWRRRDKLRELGVDSRILSFQRAHLEYTGHQSDWISLGTVRNRNYLARIPVLLSAVPKVMRHTLRGDILYCFGLDLLALGWVVSLLRRGVCPLVYEVADIRAESLGAGLGARFLRAAERFLLKRTLLVVSLSEHYVNGFYLGRLKATDVRYFVLENKPDPAVLPPREQARHARGTDTLVIGYFGMLRCQESWDFLVRLAEEGADHVRVVTAGMPSGVEGLERDVAAHPNLEYLGPYVSPDDLVDLYGRVDLVWTVYPSREPNRAWARTNRFYEAGYFRKPMIAAVETADGAEIARADLGPLIDPDAPDEAIRTLLGITEEQVRAWERAYDAVDVSTFVMADEHEQLLDVITDAEASR